MDSTRVADALSGHFAAQAQAHGIVCAYLYGSVARGQAHPGSDVDVAVLFQQAPPSTLDGLAFDIAGELERLLHRPVDLVVLNRASPDLVHRVLRDGILVHESDAAERVRFETRLLDFVTAIRERLQRA